MTIITYKVAKLFVQPNILATFVLNYLTVKHRKSQKIAPLLNRYHYYFSKTPLKVYSSIGYINPIKI